MSMRRCRAARSAPRRRQLTIMVGGSEAAFSRVKPLFELMGKNITLVGDVGAGQTTKVANQIIVALTIEAVGEALLFASKAGADPAKVRQALMGGFASSRILEVHGERMIKRTFDPGFRIELHQKDLSLALAGARALNLSLPNTATTQELFNAAAALGGKGWDHSGLVQRPRTPRRPQGGEGVDQRSATEETPLQRLSRLRAAVARRGRHALRPDLFRMYRSGRHLELSPARKVLGFAARVIVISPSSTAPARRNHAYACR